MRDAGASVLRLTETTQHKIAVLLAKYFLRAGRGKGLTARLTDVFKDALDGTVYLYAIKGFFGVIIDPKYLIAIVISKSIIEYFLGWADQKFGFWKIENSMTTQELNPITNKMSKQIDEIHAAVIRNN